MSDCDDDDVHICDTCQDIFLTREELVQHEHDEHVAKPAPVKEEVKDKESGKRSRSGSLDSKELPRKKPKMGPASKVKRDVSSSEDDNVDSKKKNTSQSRSASPDIRKSKSDEPTNRQKSESRERSEKPDSERQREKDKHHKKHKKHKDRDRSRDRDRDRVKDRDKERDRDKDRERERIKEKILKEKLAKINGERKRDRDSSDDDEERNRRRAEKAKLDWKKKDDESRGKEVRPFKKSDMDDFINDGDDRPKLHKTEFKPRPPKPLEDSPKKSVPGGFASQGTVKAHDNDGGPECFKCGQVCKDNSNLKNHVLSHYYQVFYDVLPDSRPFECPLCDKPNRDRITLVRHYAFTHNKFFEMTDVTSDDIAGMGKRSIGVRPPKPPKPKSEKSESVVSSDKSKMHSKEDDVDIETKIKNMKSSFFKINDGSGNKDVDSDEKRKEHKKHKKHKHKEHKEHKHKKDKKHKKEKHREREKSRDEPENSSSNPLTSLMKDMSPVSDSQSQSPPPPVRNGQPRTPPGSPPRGSGGYRSPERDEHEDSRAAEKNADESEDELADLDLGDIAPVFA